MLSTSLLPQLYNSLWVLACSIIPLHGCWAHKKWNKVTSDIKLVFYSWTMTMMHGPINIRYVILIALPLQQWLHEPASILRHTYVACLVLIDKIPLVHTWYWPNLKSVGGWSPANIFGAQMLWICLSCKASETGTLLQHYPYWIFKYMNRVCVCVCVCVYLQYIFAEVTTPEINILLEHCFWDPRDRMTSVLGGNVLLWYN